MTESSSLEERDGSGPAAEGALRIAAAGDLHCREANRREIKAAFAHLAGRADLVLLAGDVTTEGKPEEAAILAAACGDLEMPVVAVLGNHDLHEGNRPEVVAALTEGGITVLERGSTVCPLAAGEVGIVGTKGFVGGFPGSHLPDFGEPGLRAVYAEATEEVKALARGLQAISMCPFRIVLLHYSPTEATLEGEPPGIMAFLGTDRLAAPIREHEPDLVLHGHAHLGRFEGAIGGVPVFNVSVPVMGRDFWLFELPARDRPAVPIH